MPSFPDSPQHHIDDKKVKKHPPNHLATRLEIQAAAGAKLPSTLAKQITQLQHLTELVRQALHGLLPEEILHECQVVYANETKLILALTSLTAINHLRYLHKECLDAFRQHPKLCQYHELKYTLSQAKYQHTLSQNNSKKPLSENTRHTITQYTNVVISHEPLRQSLLKLAQGVPELDENPQ